MMNRTSSVSEEGYGSCCRRGLVTDVCEKEGIPVPEGETAVCAAYHPLEGSLAIGFRFLSDEKEESPAKSEVVFYGRSMEKKVRRTLGENGQIVYLCYSRSGRMLACITDQAVHILTKRQDKWFRLNRENDAANDAAACAKADFSGDESFLKSRDYYWTWYPMTGELQSLKSPLLQEKTHPSCNSPDEKLTAEAEKNRIRLLALPDRTLIREWEVPEPEVLDITFSPEGETLCACCGETVRLYTLMREKEPAEWVDWDPEADTLAEAFLKDFPSPDAFRVQMFARELSNKGFSHIRPEAVPQNLTRIAERKTKTEKRESRKEKAAAASKITVLMAASIAAVAVGLILLADGFRRNYLSGWQAAMILYYLEAFGGIMLAATGILLMYFKWQEYKEKNTE